MRPASSRLLDQSIGPRGQGIVNLPRFPSQERDIARSARWPVVQLVILAPSKATEQDIADMTPPSAWSVVVQISTSEYKISPLKKAARQLLGYPHPRRVPRGVYIEQAIGISTDEFTRAKNSGVQYLRNVFPLIELGWDRARCVDYLAERGFEKTVKSACVGCPFHGNAGWRWIRDNDPGGWAEAVEFDSAIRDGYPHATRQGQQLRGQYFLHRSCRPLDQVNLDPSADTKRQLRLVTMSAADEEDDPDGCSPWSCRSGAPVTAERAA